MDAVNEKKYEHGAVICKEGEKGGELYLIVSGSVAVEKKAEGGAKTVARLGAGEFFGEMSFLQGLPISATVVAQEPTGILMLSRGSLDDLMKKDPKAAMEQMFRVSTTLSNRLRSTTRELVTVFETARAVGSAISLEELGQKVVGQLSLDLGPTVSVALYRWNIFNNEYALTTAAGPMKDKFPAALEPEAQPSFSGGRLVNSKIDMLNEREGLCLYYTPSSEDFSPGERQMMETISAVLAPALATTRHREEEASRQMLQRNKQGFSL